MKEENYNLYNINTKKKKRRIPQTVVIVVQLLSCVRLFVTAMDGSTSGLPVLHYLPEFAQVHVHWIGEAI